MEAESPSEQALVRHVRRGDRDAFGELVRRHQVGVFNVCYRLLGERSEAEDMTQEAFLRAYTKLARFDEARPFGPWVRRLAVNVSLNRLSSRRPAQVALDDRVAVAMPIDHGSPEALALRSDRAGAVRAAILALPPHYRAVIELRHFHDLNYDEIAATLGLPLSDVKSHLFRARRALAHRLAEHGLAERRLAEHGLAEHGAAGHGAAGTR